MSTLSRAALPVALFALAGLATSASAQIVQDGNFESAAVTPGDTTTFYQTGTGFDGNWTITGEVGIDLSNLYVYNGSKSLYLNSGTEGIDSISQNIATDPTQFYTVSFFANDDTMGDVLNVSFGGTTFASVAVAANGYNGPPPGNDGLFTQYTFSGLTTATPFSALVFSSDGTNLSKGNLEIDDITISSSPVPEASTSVSLGLLFMLGLGAVFAAKKKSASAAV